MSQLPEDKRLQFVPQEERPPMSPQLALRVAMVGTVALALFAILFFRLWFLQVLSSDQYAHAASRNFIRPVEIAAPRGEIVDRTGTILASSQRAYAVQISPPDLPVPLTRKLLAHPPQQDAALYNRLAQVVGLPTKRQKCRVGFLNPNAHPPSVNYKVFHISQIACAVVQEYVQLPYAEATVATDITRAQLYYLSERRSSFPGVSVQQIYQRTYPLKDVAAQVLGIVSRITATQVKNPFYKGASQNDSVGQSGLEASYDRYLRGVDGAQRVRVDALGNFVGVMSQVPPTAGNNLKLSLDAKLEAGRPAGPPGVDRLELPGQRRRVRRHEPGERPGLRDGLAAHLQREPVHQAGPPVGVRRDVRAHLGRSAGQPRRSGRRTDRLDLQADHRHRGARERRVEHQQRLRRHRSVLHLGSVPAQRRRGGGRLARPGERDQGLL